MAAGAGLDDVTIGYVHSLRGEYSLRNRHQKETLERVLGTFVAPLPVRVVITPTTTGNEVADGVAADSNGGNAETGDLKKTAATQDQGSRTLGVVVIFREHYLIPCEKIRHAAGAEASG